MFKKNLFYYWKQLFCASLIDSKARCKIRRSGVWHCLYKKTQTKKDLIKLHYMVLDNKKTHEKNHVIHTILHIFWSATTMYLLICPLFIKIFEASHWPSDHLISTKMGLPGKASHWAKNVFSRTGIKMCLLVCTNMRLVQKLWPNFINNS